MLVVKKLKNALNTVKNTPIPVGVKWADTGIGVKLPYVEYSTVGDVKKSFGAGGSVPKVGSGDSKFDELYERAQNIRNDIQKQVDEIRNSDEYKNLSNTQKNKLDRKLDSLTYGNVAVADVNIPGVKTNYQAHSQVHSADSFGDSFGDFTHSKDTKSLESYVDDKFPRYNDTEVKILEDIASQIKDPNIIGEIHLFSDFDVCQSCTNLIFESGEKSLNIKLDIYTNSMK